MASIIYPTIYNALFNEFGSQRWWPADTKEEVIVGAVLTQNTNWGNVERALDNLKSAGGISLAYIHGAVEDKLAELVRPAGYFNQKTRTLKNLARYVFETNDGRLESLLNSDKESLRKALLSVKGIGPETADSIVLYAAEKPVFVVDAYTRRIMHRHGLCDEAIDYERLRAMMEQAVPESVDIYGEYHALLVKLGKTFCKKNNPLCGECPLRSYLD